MVLRPTHYGTPFTLLDLLIWTAHLCFVEIYLLILSLSLYLYTAEIYPTSEASSQGA